VVGFSFAFCALEAAMKTLITSSLILAVAAAGAQTGSQTQIRHVATSLNHLTVLEFGEVVTTLAIGDPDSFQVERAGDKVFIKPLEAGVSTNLFVWTGTRELNYELDPAGQVGAMDVLVNAVPPLAPKPGTRASAEPSDEEIRKIASLVLTQALAGSEDITQDGVKSPAGGVEVALEQFYRAKDRLYIRYSVTNLTKTPFRVLPPDVFASLPTQQPISLVSLKNHQITPKTFGQFKTKQGSVLTDPQAEAKVRDLAPGEKTTGVVSFGAPLADQPQIYQLDFGADQGGPIRVEVVL
jgi:hypothetical protein